MMNYPGVIQPCEIDSDSLLPLLHIKSVKRGKVKAACNLPCDFMHPASRSSRTICVASTFGFVFQVGCLVFLLLFMLTNSFFFLIDSWGICHCITMA